MGAVGEEARGGDRPRRAHLGRAQLARHLGDLARELARRGAAGIDDLAVDARDVDAAADEVVGDAAAGRELGVAGLDHAQLDLVLLRQLPEQRDHARVHVAGADVLLRVGVEHEVLVLEQGARGGLDRAARLGRRDAGGAPGGLLAAVSVGVGAGAPESRRRRAARRPPARESAQRPPGGRSGRRRGRGGPRLAADVDRRLRLVGVVRQVGPARHVLGVFRDVLDRLLGLLGGLGLGRLLLGDLLRRRLGGRLGLRGRGLRLRSVAAFAAARPPAWRRRPAARQREPRRPRRSRRWRLGRRRRRRPSRRPGAAGRRRAAAAPGCRRSRAG